MPWIIGVDEAGYGPNLGPFVMTSVACRLPDRLAGADLWDVLRVAVRRHDEPDDGRFMVADSKLVYTPARGLADLETGVLSATANTAATLAEYLRRLCGASLAELGNEPWYSGQTALPLKTDAEAIVAVARRYADACTQASVSLGQVRSVLVCPARFNQLLDHWDSKGAVLGQAFAELLRGHLDLDGDGESTAFFVDKHGGRNTYAAMLQDALPDGLVVAHEEGALRSRYSVLGLGRDLCLTFQPRADAEHFCVALASMVSKYLRELLMAEFNAFWQGHVPGLKPTAGYPGDAVRFLDAIRPTLRRLGLAEETVWRRR